MSFRTRKRSDLSDHPGSFGRSSPHSGPRWATSVRVRIRRRRWRQASGWLGREPAPAPAACARMLALVRAPGRKPEPALESGRKLEPGRVWAPANGEASAERLVPGFGKRATGAGGGLGFGLRGGTAGGAASRATRTRTGHSSSGCPSRCATAVEPKSMPAVPTKIASMRPTEAVVRAEPAVHTTDVWTANPADGLRLAGRSSASSPARFPTSTQLSTLVGAAAPVPSSRRAASGSPSVRSRLLQEADRAH